MYLLAVLIETSMLRPGHYTHSSVACEEEIEIVSSWKSLRLELSIIVPPSRGCCCRITCTVGHLLVHIRESSDEVNKGVLSRLGFCMLMESVLHGGDCLDFLRLL